MENKIFNIDSVQTEVEILKIQLRAAYVNVAYSTIGGNDRVSILITISKEKLEDWTNRILENSNYMKLYLKNDGELSYISGNLKMRKSKNKSIEQVIERINKFLSE
jgi:hypothetical protein